MVFKESFDFNEHFPVFEALDNTSVLSFNIHSENRFADELSIILTDFGNIICNFFFNKVFISHELNQVAYCSFAFEYVLCYWTCLIHFLSYYYFLHKFSPSVETISDICYLNF